MLFPKQLFLLVPFLTVHSVSEGFYLEVPFVQQVGNYCGPAVLAMALRYWDYRADQYEIAGRFEPFPKKGLNGMQLKQYADEIGFSAYSFEGDRNILIEHLRKGRPLIVALDQPFPAVTNHYVLLVGWIASSEEWIVHDPSAGPYKRLSAEQFEVHWKKLRNWTLLVLPGSAQ